RLLKETEQRAAELAIINSVQEGLASKLEMQGIYELVGDKIREIFHDADVGIRILDAPANLMTFPYTYEQGKRIEISPSPFKGEGFAGHVMRTRQPLLVNRDIEARSVEYGSFIFPGTASGKSALFVPLLAAGEARGVITLINYDREDAFSESDVHLLTTVAGAMRTALENARLFDETQRLLKETEQRAAELAIINSVQEGLASKLDIQGIYELVGEKVREIFDANTVVLATFDLEKNLMHRRYTFEKGERMYLQPHPIPANWSSFIESGRTSLINRNVLQILRRFEPDFQPPSGQVPKSVLSVPLKVQGQVRGAISLQNVDRENAFSESDQRLLETVAGSMSVALENARLFDETQRLLKETEQRAAELAIINSVQEGLASKLDIQGIYELVGEKVREIFDANTVVLATFDLENNLMFRRYVFEKGERMYIEPQPIPVNWRWFIEQGQPVLINTDVADFLQRIEPGFKPPSGLVPKSVLNVPLKMHGQVRGVISLQNVDRENAFNESHQRLLETLGGSMSVALENARLFDETQRLLKETEQRAAELAIINSVQEGLASKLEMQAIYDLVGDKIREIFRCKSMYIAIPAATPELAEFPYLVTDGVRVHDQPPVAISGFGGQVYRTRQPLLLTHVDDALKARFDSPQLGIGVGSGAPSTSWMGVPMLRHGEVVAVISLQSVEPEGFAEADLRVLQTLTNSMSVALENARLFDETQRLLKETEQRAAELAIINSVQEGLASKLEMQAIYDLVGEKIHEIFPEA
ncbi:MAG TPA: GAF domain-containing protein, partial [Anaerolineales bacterium]